MRAGNRFTVPGARRRWAVVFARTLAIVSGVALSSQPLASQNDVGTGVSAPTADVVPATDNAIFARSNARFQSARSVEDLRAAARGYRELLRKGHRNGHLYYNLGNTYLRLGSVGRAIVNFRRALAYIPDDPYAAAMLGEAETRVRQQIPDLYRGTGGDDLFNTLFFWHYRSSFHGRLWCLILASTGFWLLLAVRLSARLPLHRFSIATLLLASLILGTSVAVDLVQNRRSNAVIIADEVTVRSGNGNEFDLAIDRPLPSGVEVQVLEARGHWRLVKLPDGSVGWIPENSLEPILESAARGSSTGFDTALGQE